MPALVKINDKSHTGGMDTVMDARADLFPADRCTVLRNAFPGDPPLPRNGCQDVLVDGAAIGYGTQHTLFKPPVKVIRAPNGNLFLFVWNYNNGTGYDHQLEMWEIDAALRSAVVSGRFSEEAFFGLLPLYGAIFAFLDREMSSNWTGTQGVSHKIIEWDEDSETFVERDLFINMYAEMALPPAVAAAASNTGLTGGLYVSYGATFVRRSDDAAFDGTGAPQEVSTFSPGDNESYESVSYRSQVLLDTTTDYSYGDTDSEFIVEKSEDGVFRISWTGDGTDPAFTTPIGSPTKALEAGDYVEVYSDDFLFQNCGTFLVREVGAAYFIVEIEDGEEDLSAHALTNGYIRLTYAKVTLTLPEDIVDLPMARKYGATHVRFTRSDHAQTAEIAAGLEHRFLVDVPFYGVNAVAEWVDTVSRATLLGESNYARMTLYTQPPNGRFAAFGAARVFLGGDPNKRGRVWYSEVPGGDGGTSFAADFPKRYASMWKINDYWHDFDPDDGQIDTGLIVFRDDLYMFKERKVFMLRNCDVTQDDDRVSDSIGCLYPNTIKVCTLPKLGEVLFFLSNEGPAIIRPGGQLILLQRFCHEQLWPNGEVLNLDTGEIMTEHTRERVHAECHFNTMWVVYGDSEDASDENKLVENHVLGLHFSADRPWEGCLEITFGDFLTAFTTTKEVTATLGTHRTLPLRHTLTEVEAVLGDHDIQIEDEQLVVHHAISGAATLGTHTTYLGSYIYDDFDDTVDTWWDSEFTGNWSRVELPPGSGEYAMVRGSDGEDQLTPNNNLVGDFILEAEIQGGASNAGSNVSIHLTILDSTGAEVCGLGWRAGDGPLRWYAPDLGTILDQVTILYSQYGTFKIKIERSGTSVTAYYDIGAGWVQFSGTVTMSGTFGLQVDGCDEHGFTYFDLWCESGFPYPPPPHP